MSEELKEYGVVVRVSQYYSVQAESEEEAKEAVRNYCGRLIESDIEEIVWDLEKTLHKLYKKYNYKPLQNFGGKTECFKI